jgi:hypothetical protein
MELSGQFYAPAALFPRKVPLPHSHTHTHTHTHINSRPVTFTASAWEWVYATNLSRLQRETRERERERETSKLHVGEAHSVLITAIIFPQRPSCNWGKIVSLCMLANLRLADLRLTTAQQRSTGQNLPSDVYIYIRALFLYMRLGGHQSTLNVMKNGKISYPCKESNSSFSVVRPLAKST